MKRLVLLALIMLSLECVAQDERDVANAVESLRKLMVDPDRVALEKLTSPDLSYGHSSGKIEDQHSFIDALVSGESNFVDISLLDQTVRVTGDVAVVRHKLSASTNDKGKGPGKVNIGILLVWKKTEGQWHLIARQAYKL